MNKTKRKKANKPPPKPPPPPKKKTTKEKVVYLCNRGKGSSFLIPVQEIYHLLTITLFLHFSNFSIPSLTFISVLLSLSRLFYFFGMLGRMGDQYAALQESWNNFCVCLCKLSWLLKSLRKLHLTGVLSTGRYRASLVLESLRRQKCA